MNAMDLAPAAVDDEPVKTFYLAPAVAADKILANIRSALGRGLPEVTPCKPHGMTLSVAGGGPSLVDTYQDMQGYIAAVNGSLAWLLDHPVKQGASYCCGIMDAGAHIADMVVADPNVRYYVASICDPAVFDKLSACDVRLWNVTPNSLESPGQVTALLHELRPERWHAIGGGCTMGVRWIDLGYFLGFRRFHLHGLDSSFRDGATHAYPDRADAKDHFMFRGRLTRPNFVAQVVDFFQVLDRMAVQNPDVIIEVFGDGLLQDECKPYRATQAGVLQEGVTAAGKSV